MRKRWKETTATSPLVSDSVYYPDSDGKPCGETPVHILNLRYLIEPLEVWLAEDPMSAVASNMFVYYERGNPRRHVSPDVFVVRGVPKEPSPARRRYLTWEEGKGPDLVIVLTSESTRDEDVHGKMAIYRDTLRVTEYFLFDPYEEYLHPRLQGYRLSRGRYARIRPVDGRLPSKVLGLHLEGDGELLRLFDPEAKSWLQIPPEEREGRLVERKARLQAEAEVERLRRELDELRRRLPPS
jgi:Uma2 family endonuclease